MPTLQSLQQDSLPGEDRGIGHREYSRRIASVIALALTRSKANRMMVTSLPIGKAINEKTPCGGSTWRLELFLSRGNLSLKGKVLDRDSPAASEKIISGHETYQHLISPGMEYRPTSTDRLAAAGGSP